MFVHWLIILITNERTIDKQIAADRKEIVKLAAEG